MCSGNLTETLLLLSSKIKQYFYHIFEETGPEIKEILSTEPLLHMAHTDHALCTGKHVSISAPQKNT